MSNPLASTFGPTAYWYLARATGVVSLVLLTASVVFGVLGPLRVAVPGRWPRFAINTLHRDVSLLVLLVIVIHIVTSILDGFAPISLVAAVVPFDSPYRPVWLGLGAFSFDLLIALTITSLLRRRLGYRSWRAVHWFAYVSWPVAVLHGLGTGTDTKAAWNLAVTAACLLAVMVAVWRRIEQAKPVYGGTRVAIIALALATPLGLAIFTFAGPLQAGWARAAGTPTKLLASGAHAVRVTGVNPPGTTTAAPTATVSNRPFSANLDGSVSETQESGGAIVDLRLRLNGGAQGNLHVRLGGTPVPGGGLQMTGSQVVLLRAGSVMSGQISNLQGQQFTARVQGTGGSFDLQASLQINNQNNTVTGSLQATPGGGG